ncbi:Bax inhibitor 1-related [Sesbania bispinosa]|nr:Bax inhibitor 1-related [Sesbania bispinosa]
MAENGDLALTRRVTRASREMSSTSNQKKPYTLVLASERTSFVGASSIRSMASSSHRSSSPPLFPSSPFSTLQSTFSLGVISASSSSPSYQQKHPHSYILLGLFTVSISLIVGVTCANTDGNIVLKTLILTFTVVSSLTGYAFWASKKGKDFSYLGPILFTGMMQAWMMVATGLTF